MVYATVFQRCSVENPVENVEKSTVSIVKNRHSPFTACEKLYTTPLHKTYFPLHFRNYVAVEFFLFFGEIAAKSSVFRDLPRKQRI